MNPKEKSELERRLTMAPAAPPPPDLAERIKRDIPDLRLLSSAPSPAHGRTFALRIAASVVLVVGSAWLGIRILSHSATETAAPIAISQAKDRAAAPPPGMKSVATIPASEGNAPPAQASEGAGATSGEIADERRIAEGAVRRPDASPRADTSSPIASFTGEPANLAPELPPPANRVDAAGTGEPAPLVAAAEPAPAADANAEAWSDEKAAAPRTSVAFAQRAGAMQDNAAGAAPAPPSAPPAAMARWSPHEWLGVPDGDAAFLRVKNAIEHGERPHDVNISGLVNYFARSAARSPRTISLDSEVSPMPLHASAGEAILRVSIDTPKSGELNREIARDVRLAIELDPETVTGHHRIGADDRLVFEEPSLPPDLSVTMVYRLNVRETRGGVIARVRLDYRDPVSGEPRTLSKVVRASESKRPWSSATLRHRLASLGAAWGETLQAAAAGSDVARRAEELAQQEPAEPRARELARLTTASARLQSFAPTGSGR